MSDRDGDPVAVAVIADLVGSRLLAREARAEVQLRLEALLQRWNGQFRPHVLSQFVVTLGDEFQGLLSDAAPLPDLLWACDYAFPDVQFRWGIGRGTLTTALKPVAIGMDGAAFHAARAAITEAKRGQKLGGVFRGFGARDDVTLGGLARLLHQARSEFTTGQRNVIDRLRRGERQVQIAADLRLTRQAITRRVQGAGWAAYAEGEAALRTTLAPYDQRETWAAARR